MYYLPPWVYIPPCTHPGIYTSLGTPVHTLVYTAALVLHGTVWCAPDEALGSKEEKPVGGRPP